MTTNIDLTGKTALITGATRGIGQAIAKDFLHAGAHVLLTGTNQSKIDKLNDANKNRNIFWMAADFSNQQGIDSFINDLKDINSIDICVNNAGINIIKSFEQYSTQEYQKLISINLTAPFMISQHVAVGMKNKGYGRLINIASIWSKVTKSGRSLYTASKHGIGGITQTLAVELAPFNILVNAVSPGFTLTELTKNSLSTNEMNDLSRQVPIHRFADPDEISKPVLFLSSNLNTYITGQNIVVDGGFSIV